MAITPTTWNPSDKGSVAVLSNGNLTVTTKATSGSVRSAFGASSGKWYWEYTSTGSRLPICGIAIAAASFDYPGSDANGWSYFGNIAKKINSGVQTSYGTTWSPASQVVGIALDLDSHSVEFFKAGSSMGVAFSSLPAGTYYAMAGGDTDSSTSNCTANFGATAFSFSPPAGFTAGFGAPLANIAGNVKDAAGTNVARTLYFYREDTGAYQGSVVSNASTGNYSFPAAYSGAHMVVAVPAGGEALDALIFRNVIPV